MTPAEQGDMVALAFACARGGVQAAAAPVSEVAINAAISECMGFMHCSLAPPRRFDAVVVILRRLFLHPSNEGCDVFMGLKQSPRAVAACQFFFGKRGVNFSVANAMHRVRLSPALAFGQKMMLVDTFASNEMPPAERAVAQSQR